MAWAACPLGVKIPWPGSLPPTPRNLANFNLKSYYIIYNIVPLLPIFSLNGKGLRPNYCVPRSFLPSVENLVNKIKVQNVILSL